MNYTDLPKYLNPSLYRILCLEKNATLEMIKSNYKELSKIEHPDKSKETQEIAHEKFLTIKFAYEVLSSVDLKAKYDVLLDKYLKDQQAEIDKKKINQTVTKNPIKKVNTKQTDEYQFSEKEQLHLWNDILTSIREAREELRNMGKDI